jgi:hypothetical protein
MGGSPSTSIVAAASDPGRLTASMPDSASGREPAASGDIRARPLRFATAAQKSRRPPEVTHGVEPAIPVTPTTSRVSHHDASELGRRAARGCRSERLQRELSYAEYLARGASRSSSAKRAGKVKRSSIERSPRLVRATSSSWASPASPCHPHARAQLRRDLFESAPLATLLKRLVSLLLIDETTYLRPAEQLSGRVRLPSPRTFSALLDRLPPCHTIHSTRHAHTAEPPHPAPARSRSQWRRWVRWLPVGGRHQPAAGGKSARSTLPGTSPCSN